MSAMVEANNSLTVVINSFGQFRLWAKEGQASVSSKQQLR
jgi:hypothetical protein